MAVDEDAADFEVEERRKKEFTASAEPTASVRDTVTSQSRTGPRRTSTRVATAIAIGMQTASITIRPTSGRVPIR